MNQDLFNNLNKSTMFHMSLGSKELFHSNFLHWISIVNWDAFLDIMHGLAEVKTFWWESKYCPRKNNLEVRREFHNFDLSIYILDSEKDATDDDSTDEVVYTENGNKIQKWIPVLILENKMKSLPYKAQLDKYVEKAYKDYFVGNAKANLVGKAKKNEVNQELNISHQNCPITFILLSLIDPSLSDDTYKYNKTYEKPKYSITFNGEWEHKTYSDLIGLLESVNLDEKNVKQEGLQTGEPDIFDAGAGPRRNGFQTFVQDKTLDKEVLKDYCRFVKALCHLAGNEWKVDEGNNYIATICKGGADERKLRIHDIREKIHYEQLLKLLEKKLTEKKISFKRFDTDEFKERESGSVFTKIDYSHGIGLFEVQYVVSKEWRLIIQVQGNRYCHMIVNDKGKSIVKKNGNVNEPICKNLLRNYGKFINDPTPNNPDWPNNVGSPNEKYGRYGYSNIYQWSEIPETCTTISQVIEAMCCDLEKIMKTWRIYMKIYDLTRGKYPKVYYSEEDLYYNEKVEQMVHFSTTFQSLFAKNRGNIDRVLNHIPVFLVESSMSCEYVSVPGCQCLVQVPEDNDATIVDTEDFDIDKWVASKEGDIPEKDDPRERTSRGFSIADLLGVYIYKGNHDIMPRRIFIWMDKIMACAERNTKVKANINGNAHALFDLVLYHELGHALMDVELYGVHPSPKFSYAKDAPYRFYEEAFANGVALSILIGDNHPIASQKPLTSQQQSFIENFIKSQGRGYSDGWELYKILVDNIDQWMGIKVLFNFEIVLLLKAMWKHYIEVFEGVGHDGWIAVKDRCDKWSIIELPSQNAVAGFKKYDRFWWFDENGLCRVREGHLYGYVNEQGVEQIPVEYDDLDSFENGITIAKKDGWYGAIDLNNKIVIPFNLPYDDVRGFRNGRAAVKDSVGWGVIDTSGNEIVPCENDSIVL